MKINHAKYIFKLFLIIFFRIFCNGPAAIGNRNNQKG